MSVKDLIGFLGSSDPNLNKIALQNILPFTPSSEGKTFLFEENDYEGLRAIKRISVQSKDPAVIENALIALVNLSDSEKVRAELASDSAALQQYAKYVTAVPKLPFVRYVSMLFTNIGREAETLEALKSTGVAALMLKTASPAVIGDEDYDFLAFAFAEFARKGAKTIAKSLPFLYPELVLHEDTKQYPMQPSLNRRKGVAATLKNALFEVDLHEPLAFDTPLIETIMICLKGDEQMDAEDYAKLPPMVRREHDENGSKREPDDDVRYTLMECLLLLSSSQSGRDALRMKNTYYIVRELHLATKNTELAEICTKFVNMVMRGDPKPTQEEDEDEDAQITEVV